MRKQKEAILCALCARTFAKGRVIIFCSTKRRAHRIKMIFDMLKLPSTGFRMDAMNKTGMWFDR